MSVAFDQARKSPERLCLSSASLHAKCHVFVTWLKTPKLGRLGLLRPVWGLLYLLNIKYDVAHANAVRRYIKINKGIYLPFIDFNMPPPHSNYTETD